MALPPEVTLITDATWSVGLPSLSATSQVPASFFSFSRLALLGGVGSFLSPPWLVSATVNIRATSPLHARIRRIVVPPQWIFRRETASRHSLVERQRAISTCAEKKNPTLWDHLSSTANL